MLTAIARRGPARRICVAGSVILLLALGIFVQVGYTWYDGCNWHYGHQPALAVPVSLVKKEPTASANGIFTARRCPKPYGRQGYEVGPFGSVPTFEEADSPEWQ